MSKENRMDDSPLNDEFELLLISVLESEASSEEFAQLLESLKASPELRKRASLFLCDESLLADEIGTTQQSATLLKSLSHHSRAREIDTCTPFAVPRKSLPARITRIVNDHGLVVAIAASLLVVGLVIQNYIIMAKVSRLHELAVVNVAGPETENKEVETDSQLASRGQLTEVGRVIGLKDVLWVEGERSFTFGDTLREGESIRLVSGVLELLLSTGAKVTVEGPVDFELPSPTRTNLLLGKIAAAVPRTARGYTIMTPTSELVDIGTQFGVVVDEAGDTELHVFDGDVMARSRLSPSVSELIHAKENEGLRFDSVSAVPQYIKASEAVFVRRLGPTYSVDELPAIPETQALALWLTADTISGVRDGDAMSTWRDLLIGENTFPNDALQLDPRQCPRYMTDDQQRPAVRFNGWSTCLVAGPLESTGRSTVFVVCAPGPTSFADGNQGGILLKYGSAQTMELSILSDHSAKGIAWSGLRGSVGIVKSEPLRPKEVAVIAYQYDSIGSKSQLWVNGVSQGVTEAPMSLQETGLMHIGRHKDPQLSTGFFGNVYEIVYYERNLNAESMVRMATYFKERYRNP